MQNWLLRHFYTFRFCDLFFEGQNANHEFHDEATASNERLEKPAKNRDCYFGEHKNSMACIEFLSTHSGKVI